MLQWIGRSLLPAGCLLAAAPANAQAGYGRIYAWTDVVDQFEPSYLAVCLPSQTTMACPADGMALLPAPELYTNLTLRVLGGPFRYRWQVENMRARLVREGFPSHALYIIVVNSSGQTLGGFWLGARPTCVDVYGQAALDGEVSADLSPTGARPQTMPVTEDAWGAYMAYVEQIRPQCEARRRSRLPPPPEGMSDR